MSDTDAPIRRFVVIGVGHRDRADDGIGPAVVDALSHRSDEVTTMIREGDLAVLPLLWDSADDVVIVDAFFAGSEPVGVLREVDVDQLTASSGLSTHGVSVADAIELARRIQRMPKRLRVIGITGRTFEHGAMSRQLHERVDELVDELLAILELDNGRGNLGQAEGRADSPS